jgi:hypothetical protein
MPDDSRELQIRKPIGCDHLGAIATEGILTRSFDLTREDL